MCPTSKHGNGAFFSGLMAAAIVAAGRHADVTADR